VRSIFVILILAVVALIAAFQFGLVDLRQTQPASLPQVEADNGAIRASRGQAPAFDVATGSVDLETRNATVAVPKVRVEAEPKQVTVPAVTLKPADAGQNAAN